MVKKNYLLSQKASISRENNKMNDFLQIDDNFLS